MMALNYDPETFGISAIKRYAPHTASTGGCFEQWLNGTVLLLIQKAM